MSSNRVPGNQVRIRTADRVLVDEIRQSPVDEYLRRSRRRIAWAVAIAVGLVVVALLAWRFAADRPTDYAQVEDHFKYGSIGSEPGGSVLSAVGGLLPPYEIFRVLPQ